MGKLPPGFRFHPTDVELVKYYLKRKVLGKKLHSNVIAEIDIYKFAPWDLPDKSCMRYGDLTWYFFCRSEKKYASGARINRSTEFGFWKTTGRDRPVHYNSKLVGMIKTLIFHRGKAPKGDRTDWVMHEYRLEDSELAENGVIPYVLSKVFQKDGMGPRNGAQYGAPFREEEWSDDDEEVNIVGAVFPGETSTPAFSLPLNQNKFIATSSRGLENICTGPSYVPCPPIVGHSACTEIPAISGDGMLMESESQCTGLLNAPRFSGGVSSGYEMLPPVSESNMVLTTSVQPGDDEILSLLASFAGQHDLFFNENENNEKLDSWNETGIVAAVPCSDGTDIYNALGDLPNLDGQSSLGYGNFFANYETGFTAPCNNEEPYVELIDLDIPFGASESELGKLGSLYGQSCHGDNASSPVGEESYLELHDLDTQLRPADS